MSVNLNRAAHTAYFSNLRGTLDALLNVVLVPVPSWGRGLVGWLLWAPPPSVICSQLTFSETSSPSFSWEGTERQSKPTRKTEHDILENRFLGNRFRENQSRPGVRALAAWQRVSASAVKKSALPGAQL